MNENKISFGEKFLTVLLFLTLIFSVCGVIVEVFVVEVLKFNSINLYKLILFISINLFLFGISWLILVLKYGVTEQRNEDYLSKYKVVDKENYEKLENEVKEQKKIIRKMKKMLKSK